MDAPLAGMHWALGRHVGVGPVLLLLAAVALLAFPALRRHGLLVGAGILACLGLGLAFAGATDVGVQLPTVVPAFAAAAFGVAAPTRRSWAVAYVCAAAGSLATDVLVMATRWQPSWDLMVVGGAGLADGLVVVPILSLAVLGVLLVVKRALQVHPGNPGTAGKLA